MRMDSLLARSLTLPSGLVLSNRIAKAAMSQGLAGADGRANARLETLYRRFGEGGAGLLVTGNVMIDGRYLERPGNVVVEDDADLDGLSRWAAAAKSGGSAAIVQISHPGRQTSRLVTSAPVAPSSGDAVRMGPLFAAPRALTAEEIADVVDRFAETARVLDRAGFDGVELHAAHGYLLSQFLSPLTNRRTDGWGGSIEARARLLLDVIAAVRGRTRRGFTIAVKLNSADFQRGGFDEDDALSVVRMLDGGGERPLIDLLEISGGNYEAPELLGGRASTRDREAYFLDFARKVRSVSRVPLMVTGGFRSRAIMESALAEDALDVVGLARPFAVDPGIARRLLAGEITRVETPRVSAPDALFAMAEAAVFARQLGRLGDGKAALRAPSVAWSVLLYLAHDAAVALGRRLGSSRPNRLPARGASAA